MKILLNDLLHTPGNLIVKEVIKKGALVFYNRHLDWFCINK